MPLIADRFFRLPAGEVVDLATGEMVCLALAPPRVSRPDHVAACDRLAALRHPLLLPLVDYGLTGAHWFEAHTRLPALRVPGADRREAALHLVRFLRAAGVELDAGLAARNVRPAVDGPAAAWRPVGVFLQWRCALDAIRAVIESSGPLGVTAISVHGPEGAGLRTARLQVARLARLSGFVVIDSRFGALEEALTPPRHLCVLDWTPSSLALPAALGLAAAHGARRHLWIRFCRDAATGASAIDLEPFMTSELMAAIHADPHVGPSAAEIRGAAAAAGGRASTLVAALSSGLRLRGGASWVHEAAAEYVAAPRAPAQRPVAAGIARLERAVAAARTIAARGRHARAVRLLERCATALAARGATHAASNASCVLGDLLLHRSRPVRAVAAFENAGRWSPDEPVAIRALVGGGCGLTEQGRLADAEAAFRTAMLAASNGDPQCAARQGLAFVLTLRGRLDAAEEVLGAHAPALLSTVLRLKGDLAGAAHAAARAIRETPASDPAGVCEARLAAVHVHAALGQDELVRSHAAGAMQAARGSRSPGLRWRAAAEVLSCLEQCGVPGSGAGRRRLLSAAHRLPPLAAARIRTALRRPGEDPEDVRRFVELSGAVIFAATPDRSADLMLRFQALLDAIHDTPDEETALQVIAADLLAAVEACSVVIRSARLGRPVASAGRAWPGEETLARAVLDGGRRVCRDGLTPEAAAPVVAGGSVLGSIAVRWVPGARPPAARAQDLLRLSAAAAAAMLKALRPAPTADADEAHRYPDDLLGRGPAADRLREAIRRAALAPYPVLIEGESGSGKELVARAIHARGPRRARRFCAVNCAALTDDLLEAELFGHARGAFTGAVSERPGLFEEADQGTLFLDEAGELTPRAQAKLLRALQEGEVRRVGENMPRKVDVRIVAATNRSLEDDVRAGRFRADLRFRLDVIRIPIPPLRDRPDEVPWLVERLWSEAATRVGTRATVGDDVVAALARYDWPGNVRELQNVIASLAVHAPRRGRVPAALLPGHIAAAARDRGCGFDQARLDFERRFIRAALARAGGRKSAAAAQLGVSRQGLAKIIKRLGILE